VLPPLSSPAALIGWQAALRRWKLRLRDGDDTAWSEYLEAVKVYMLAVSNLTAERQGATMVPNAGFTGEIVMALGGWKSGQMMRRYAAVTDQTLRAAAEAVSGHERLPLRRRGGPRRSEASPRRSSS
jgi:hypothetical protein